MRSVVSLSDEDDNGSSSSIRASTYCWWRASSEFEESRNFKIDFTCISSLTPKVKVLREMERLALVASEGLDDLRHKLLNYRSGDFWLPIGGIKKEDMEIPQVATILLVGFSGSGKSSLINLMYSVLGRSGLIPFAQTSGKMSNYRTIYLEEHNVLRSMRSGFCVYDSRGLDYDRVGESLEMVSRWMADGVHHQQLCVESGDELLPSTASLMPSSAGYPMPSSSCFVKRRVNCAVVVVNMAEVCKALTKGDSKPLEATRELFYCPALRNCNENPILILTHGDLLTPEDRIAGRVKICEFLGVSEATGTYDILCLTEHGFLPEESDPVTAYALMESMYRALIFSDRSHCPRRSFKDWAVIVFANIMCAVSTLLTFLASIFSKLGQIDNKLKQ
ncbi:hypothetical protein Syun_008013 [Stephania yunnanensis]|uniref:Uncharacterized protein n=1 Tax=Stephania yunnanensis TaxID=152371 RepID=A0AAP0L184_9MAGN